MSKLARVLMIAVAATIALFASGNVAIAQPVSQTKYWAGLGGETVCNVPFAGQGFSAQDGTKYTVTVRPVLGGQVQAKIRFLLANNSWTEALPFTDQITGITPANAVEAWVTVCHTQHEVSYGPVNVTQPVIIEYRDGQS